MLLLISADTAVAFAVVFAFVFAIAAADAVAADAVADGDGTDAVIADIDLLSLPLLSLLQL